MHWARGLTRGSTYENRVNLAPGFFDQIIRKYEGTRLGRQELNPELLDDVPGALWSRARLEELRWPVYKSVPDLVRIVIAIDPATTSGEDADETGIIVAGKDAGGRGYVLADRSGHYTPSEWAQAAIALYRQHKADRIVAEVNNGGGMVEATLRMIDPNVPYTAVHASRGKVVRAEPVAALYEQQPGRVFHVGAFPTLEDQMCGFTTDFDRKTAGFSPDRVDALVWAMSDLLVEPEPGAAMIEYYRLRAREAAEKKAALAAERVRLRQAMSEEKALTPAQADDLRVIAGVIIPASEEFDVPGADDPTIQADIVATLGRDAAFVADALDMLARIAGAPLAGLDPAQRETVAIELRAKGGAAVATLTRVVLQCYYRDDRVVRSLGLEPRPPYPKGHVLEDGDWLLLDPVRARPPFWRRA